MAARTSADHTRGARSRQRDPRVAGGLPIERDSARTWLPTHHGRACCPGLATHHGGAFCLVMAGLYPRLSGLISLCNGSALMRAAAVRVAASWSMNVEQL